MKSHEEQIRFLTERLQSLENTIARMARRGDSLRPCVIKVLNRVSSAGVTSLHKYEILILSGESAVNLAGDLAMPEDLYVPTEDIKGLGIHVSANGATESEITSFPKYQVGVQLGTLDFERGRSDGGPPIVAFGGSGGTPAGKFGKISAYTAGANTVTLTPCSANGTATGADDITAYIELPTTKTVCSFFAGVVGGVIAYATIESVNFLISYPLPASNTKSDVFAITNVNGTGGFDSVRLK